MNLEGNAFFGKQTNTNTNKSKETEAQRNRKVVKVTWLISRNVKTCTRAELPQNLCSLSRHARCQGCGLWWFWRNWLSVHAGSLISGPSISQYFFPSLCVLRKKTHRRWAMEHWVSHCASFSVRHGGGWKRLFRVLLNQTSGAGKSEEGLKPGVPCPGTAGMVASILAELIVTRGLRICSLHVPLFHLSHLQKPLNSAIFLHSATLQSQPLSKYQV